ncbi:MAG: hypothetical protein VW080_02975 [Flavobacteriaceae bacterium]
MKHFIWIAFLGTTLLTAQKLDRTRILTNEGDQIKFSEYYENGQLAQTGYLYQGKNHGTWISFDQQGNKLSEGIYHMGKKVNRWFFWNQDALLEVEYKNNVIERAVKWDNGSDILASQ